MKKNRFFAFCFVVLLAATLSGCGGKGTSGGYTPPSKTTPTITWATPAAITYGIALSSTQLNATASIAGGSFVYTPASGTVLAAGTQTLSVVFTPSAADTANYNTASGSVQLTVNKATPTITTPPTATAITSGQTLASSTLSGGVASVPGTFAWAAPSTIPAAGASVSESVTFTPTDTANYTTATVSVTVLVTPTLTAINGPFWLIGQGSVNAVFSGSGFAGSQTLSCTTNTNIMAVTLDSSTQVTVAFAFDQSHMGFDNRYCKICLTADLTGCSATVKFGLYGPNPAVVVPSGIKLRLNSAERIPGQNMLNGVPRPGYVDEFSPVTGVPNGVHCFLGPAVAAIAADSTTGWFSNGPSPIDPATCTSPLNAPSMGGGGDPGTKVGVKAGNGQLLYITKNTVNCTSWLGGPNSTNPIYTLNAGTNNQSLGVGTVGGNTFGYVFDASGLTLTKSDTNCNLVLSQSVTGITAGAPKGTEILPVDSLGVLVLISYGDNIANVLSQNDLKPVAAYGNHGVIALPPGEKPVSAIALGTVIIIGNDSGDFTEVKLSDSSANVVTPGIPFLPAIAPAVPADGGSMDFWACPSDGTACFPLIGGKG